MGRLYFGDKLEILRRPIGHDRVDMVYRDLPYEFLFSPAATLAPYCY